MNLSVKQLAIGATALIVLAFGVAFTIFKLTGDDANSVADLTETERAAACSAWNSGAREAANRRAIYLMTRDADVTVFLAKEISASDRKKLEKIIKGRPEVASVFFESRADAYERFIELFANEPAILAATTADALPESFRVVLRSEDGFDAFRDAVARRPEVDKVRDDRHLVRGNFEGVLYRYRQQGFYLDRIGNRVNEPPGCTV